MNGILTKAAQERGFLEGQKITRTCEAAIKSINPEDYTIEVCVSDASIDRHEEIISLKAWTKRLKHYLENPIFCWGHPLSKWDGAPPEDCIGKALWVEVREDGLWCKFEYAATKNPRAKLIWDLVAGGYLKAFSIGAIVWACVYFWDPEEEWGDLTAAEREALKSGAVYCVVTDAELIEVSQVFVGSNRTALARAFKDGVMTRDAAKSLIGGQAVKQPQATKTDTPEAEAPAQAEPTPEPTPEAQAGPETEAPGAEPAAEPTEEEQLEALLDSDPEAAKAFFELIAPLL